LEVILPLEINKRSVLNDILTETKRKVQGWIFTCLIWNAHECISRY